MRLLLGFVLLLLPACSDNSARTASAGSGRRGDVSERTITDYADAESGVIWRADHETGNIEQWEDGGRIAISGRGSQQITDQVAHSGRYSLALTIAGADGASKKNQAVRMEWQATRWVGRDDPKNLPDEAYYSVYFLFPQLIKSTTWWNVFQWKQSQIRDDGSQTRPPVYSIHPIFHDGAMFFRLRQRVDDDGEYADQASVVADATIPIPIGSWVQLECFYRWAKDPSGQITCWQDGQLIFDIHDVITEFDWPFEQYPRQWTANNYANRTDPPDQTIYIDDATISLKRSNGQ